MPPVAESVPETGYQCHGQALVGPAGHPWDGLPVIPFALAGSYRDRLRRIVSAHRDYGFGTKTVEMA